MLLSGHDVSHCQYQSKLVLSFEESSSTRHVLQTIRRMQPNPIQLWNNLRWPQSDRPIAEVMHQPCDYACNSMTSRPPEKAALKTGQGQNHVTGDSSWCRVLRVAHVQIFVKID